MTSCILKGGHTGRQLIDVDHGLDERNRNHEEKDQSDRQRGNDNAPAAISNNTVNDKAVMQTW